MGNKSTPSSQPKKPARTLKEKRAAKHAKDDAKNHPEIIPQTKKH